MASGQLEAFYRQSSAFAFYASVDGLWTWGLTGERQVLLGGNSGLRAYPQRYQAGDRRLRLRLEERWISSAHPFELFRYGAAVFFDAGRAWFAQDPNSDTEGTLANAGAGLRLTSDRAPTDSILHLDFAVPLRRGGGKRGRLARVPDPPGVLLIQVLNLGRGNLRREVRPEGLFPGRRCPYPRAFRCRASPS